MGAVALSSEDENLLKSLQKELGAPSKSQVIRQALQELKVILTRQKLAHEVQKSVQKCRQADLEEHASLTGAAVSRQEE